MVELAQQSAPTGCPVPMSDDLPCERPIHPAPSDVDVSPVCLMHSRSQTKDMGKFADEIRAILKGRSAFHGPKDVYDFNHFVFPKAQFDGTRFELDVSFVGVIFAGAATFYRTIFGGKANFVAATFAENAMFLDAAFGDTARFAETMFKGDVNFAGVKFAGVARFCSVHFAEYAHFYRTAFAQEANFEGAQFSKEATFTEAVFSGDANFYEARFEGEALFDLTSFGPLREISDTRSLANSCGQCIADFRGAQFADVSRVRFYQANKNSGQSLRIRLSNSNVCQS